MFGYDFEGFQFDNLPIEDVEGPVSLDMLCALPEENFLVPDQEYDFGGSDDFSEKKWEEPEEGYDLSMLDVLPDENPKVLYEKMLDECNTEMEIKINTKESDGSDAEDADDDVENNTHEKLPKSTKFNWLRSWDRLISLHNSIKKKYTNTETSYHCSECNFQTKLISPLIIHIKAAHHLKYESTVAPNQCSECFLQMKDMSGLILHVKTVHNLNNENVDELKIFECPECPFSTKHIKLYEIHKSYYHEEIDHDCRECAFKTNILKDFESHMESHQSSQILHMKTDLDIRNRKVNKLKIFKCSECAFSTKYRKNYFMHKSYHKKRNYSYSECVYTTKLLKNFESHRGSHQKGSKLYKCSTCSFSTNIKGSLTRHSILHSKIKSFSCKVCPYFSNRKEHFKTHILKHKSDDENAYKCDQCNFKTIWKGSYTRHIKEHNSLKYSCPYCDFKCIRKSYLRQHVNYKHKNISEPQEVSIKFGETQ